MGDPVEGPLDTLRLWGRLRDLSGEEQAEAITELEEIIEKREKRRPSRYKLKK